MLNILDGTGWQIQSTRTLGVGVTLPNPATGPSLALNGDFLFVQDQNIEANREGRVFVLKRNGTAWEDWQTLTDQSGLSQAGWFGYAISTSGDWLAVGSTHAYNVTTDGEGDVQMFKRNSSTDLWEFTQYIQPDNISVADEFGDQVDVDGDWMVVGAPWHDGAATSNAGGAWFFENVAGTWTERQYITEPTPAINGQFGISVSISGSKVFVTSAGLGVRGEVHYYELSAGTWSYVSTITPLVSRGFGEWFGIPVVAHGDRLLISATMKGVTDASGVGAVFFFDWNGSNWIQTSRYIPSDFAKFSIYGHTSTVSGDVAVIGSLYADATIYDPINQNNGKGRAHVFKHNGSAWVLQSVLAPTDRQYGDWFASGLATNETDIFVLSFGCVRNEEKQQILTHYKYI